MVSHSEVAKAFVKGEKATGSRMFTDGVFIYSHNYHFPISLRLKDGSYLFNTDNYSVSTSKHKNYVKYALSGKEVIECDTNTIKNAISNPDNPIIIFKDKEVTILSNALDILRDVCKNNYGLKKFPYTQIEMYLTNKFKTDTKQEHKLTILINNKLSLKKFEKYVKIKFDGKEINLPFDYAGDVAHQLKDYAHPSLYTIVDFMNIIDRFEGDEDVVNFVKRVMCKEVTEEEMNKIRELNRMAKEV